MKKNSYRTRHGDTRVDCLADTGIYSVTCRDNPVAMKTIRELRITDIRSYAYHGYYESESVIGAEFSVDLAVIWENAPRVHDELENTVDYEKLHKVVVREMMVPSKLLETVAERIADHIARDFPYLSEIEVTIHKLVQMGGPVKRASVTERRKI